MIIDNIKKEMVLFKKVRKEKVDHDYVSVISAYW